MTSKSGIFRHGIWIWIFLLIALRFVLWNETVFILDEPLFQMKIDEHFANGTFPLTTFRGSSIPLPYGAGAVWFYMLLRIFVWHPYAIVLYHIAAVTFGALLFLRTMIQKFGEEPTRWSGLLLASSPLLFFLARHPWDNTLIFTLCSIVIWSLVQLERQKRECLYHAIMGATAGYALNIHLMFGPVALALGLTLLLRSWKLYGLRSKYFWMPLLTFGGIAFLMLVPYLWESLRIIQVEKPLEHTTHTTRWGDGRNLWWLIQRSVIFSSIWGSKAYLRGVYPQFYAFVGQPLAFLFHNDLFGWFAKIAALFSTVAYPIYYLRKRVAFDALRFFAWFAFVCMVLVLHFLNIPTEPHYFHSVWFLVFLGVAVTIPRLSGTVKKFFLGTLFLTALVNTAYILTSLGFIHVNKGARNYGFSVTVGEQIRALREICEEASHRIPKEARVDLADAFVAGPGYVYLPKHMPECAGVSFTSDHKLPNPNFRLSHPADSATKADIIVNWVQP